MFIRCWTVMKAVAVKAKVLTPIKPRVVTGYRRVRRAKRAAVAGAVMVPTVVCAVVGIGAAGGAFGPGGMFGPPLPPVPSYGFPGASYGYPPLDQPIKPTQVPTGGEILILLGAIGATIHLRKRI